VITEQKKVPLSEATFCGLSFATQNRLTPWERWNQRELLLLLFALNRHSPNRWPLWPLSNDQPYCLACRTV